MFNCVISEGGNKVSKNIIYDDFNLEQVYNRHVDMVYRICFLILKNTSDAEDVVQSTFIKLIETGKVFNDVEHEKAWLIVTARNQCKNLIKYWWRKFQTSIDNIDEQNMIYMTHDDALKLVLALPSKYKLPIYLYYYEGYKVSEISTILNIKESTIRSQLCKGRDLLKIKIGGEDYE